MFCVITMRLGTTTTASVSMVSCCFLHRVGYNERLMKDFIYVVRYVGFFCACMSFLCKLFYVIAFYVL